MHAHNEHQLTTKLVQSRHQSLFPCNNVGSNKLVTTCLLRMDAGGMLNICKLNRKEGVCGEVYTIPVHAQEMIRPGLLAVLAPCAVGLGFRVLGFYTGQALLGAKAVAGLLMFSMVAGAQPPALHHTAWRRPAITAFFPRCISDLGWKLAAQAFQAVAELSERGCIVALYLMSDVLAYFLSVFIPAGHLGLMAGGLLTSMFLVFLDFWVQYKDDAFHRHPDGAVFEYGGRGVGQRKEVHRERCARRQGLRRAQGRGDGRHGRRPLQGHRGSLAARPHKNDRHHLARHGAPVPGLTALPSCAQRCRTSGDL